MPAHTTLADAPIKVPFPKQTGKQPYEKLLIETLCALIQYIN